MQEEGGLSYIRTCHPEVAVGRLPDGVERDIVLSAETFGEKSPASYEDGKKYSKGSFHMV